ncbi:MAG: glycosyltransferase [Melioribacteraceae bacterium]
MKIAAVVVTYNRLEYLRSCIESLCEQSFKLDKIIVIDNSSDDGTWEYLQNLEFVDATRQENIGGAGGFYSGIKKAYLEGYDLIWCMDDDNEPDHNALKYLLESTGIDMKIYNSLCLEKITNAPCFGLYINGKLSLDINEIKKYKRIESANYFNGTLVPRKVIKMIGFPNPYYWEQGDNYDYFLEAIEKDIPSITITKSIIYHPKQNYRLYSTCGYSYKYAMMNPFKKKIFIRNILFIFKTHRTFTMRNLFRVLIFELICMVKYQLGNIGPFVAGIIIGNLTRKKTILMRKEYPTK